MSRVALISNSGSGSADDFDLPAILREHGLELQCFEIGQAAAAAECGAERVIVAGGDGSIAVAAQAAMAARVPLAAIPAGTANDFAARMGLPSDLEKAARIAAEGNQTRDVDLAQIGERSFVNVASLGLPPTAAEAAKDLKEQLGALAYTVGALRASIDGEPIGCRICCEDKLLYEGDCWQVTVGCTGAFGGGSQIDADADDGRLDVVVIEGGPRLRLAKHALGLRRGRVEQQKGVHHSRCREITIETGSGEELNVDGELVAASELHRGADQPLRFEIAGRFELVTG